jgi:hypothetical protein
MILYTVKHFQLLIMKQHRSCYQCELSAILDAHALALCATSQQDQAPPGFPPGLQLVALAPEIKVSVDNMQLCTPSVFVSFF